MEFSIAVCILNYNGADLLKQFLPSFIEFSEGYPIYVIDNASKDDSCTLIKNDFPEVKLIINEKNGGFAKGYNDGLKHITADYYIIVNSDILVTKSWITGLTSALKDEQVVAVQPKIRSYRNQAYFEHAGACGGYLDKNYYPFCRGRLMDIIEEDKQQYEGVYPVTWTSGACMLVHAKSFWQIGGFDEDFFAHMEEIDLCLRLSRTGKKLVYTSEATVFHVGGATLSYQSPQKVFLNFRNNLFLIVKHHPRFLFFKVLWRLCLDGIAGLQFLVKGQAKQTWAILRAHGSFYRNLASMLKKRKTLKKQLQHTDFYPRYKGNILWAFYVKKIKTFPLLNQRLFENDR